MFIKVKIKPKARREELQKVGSDRFKVSVREPAERGLANERARRLIAHHFKILVSRVKIKTGQRARSKIIEIRS